MEVNGSSIVLCNVSSLWAIVASVVLPLPTQIKVTRLCISQSGDEAMEDNVEIPKPEIKKVHLTLEKFRPLFIFYMQGNIWPWHWTWELGISSHKARHFLIFSAAFYIANNSFGQLVFQHIFFYIHGYAPSIVVNVVIMF